MEAISRAIGELEEQHGVRVLLAVESGSRAWGFESTDSDFDIRFLYVHPLPWYVSIETKRAVIEAMLPGDLDFAGWDLRKALGLLRTSNPSLLEWLASPIVYREDTGFAQDLRALARRCYSPFKCFHHYLSMAKGNIRGYFSGEEVPLKKYLYVLRPVLAAKWIEEERGPVPMELSALIDAVVCDADIRAEIDRLVTLKKSQTEMGTGKKIPLLQAFLEGELDRLENVRVVETDLLSTEELDSFLHRYVLQ